VRVKKFLAKNLPEAVTQVKSELGVDAVILHIDEVRIGGIMGLFGKRMVQVVAATDESLGTKAQRPTSVVPAPVPVLTGFSDVAQAPVRGEIRHETTDEGKLNVQVNQPMFSDLERSVVHLRQNERVSGLLEFGEPIDPVLDSLKVRLSNGGVDPKVGLQLVERVRTVMQRHHLGVSDAYTIARRLMLEDLGQVTPIQLGGQVIALMGPTGVGKTTTVAKLAAYFALQKRARVSLIAADTYRVAAVEQLRTYGEILGIPVEVAYDPSELAAAVVRQRMWQRDLILVDTAGRSPHNTGHMSELKAYMEALQPDKSYLVMSMTSGFRDAQATVDQYKHIGFDGYLFTKWDESVAPGLIYNVVSGLRRPLTYITTGQSVPEDIEVANPDMITQTILGD
jgi:flagellar biosynthesis protein FlhF